MKKNEILVDYDMSSNYFRCYNEAQGVMIDKKNILKRPNVKISGYLERCFSYFLFTTLLFLVALLFQMRGLYLLFYILYGGLFLYVLLFVCGYFTEMKKVHVGKLHFNSEGILDVGSEGIQVQMNWEHILGIVILKHTVTIITDNMIFFFVNIECKNDILLAVDKYKKDLLVIDKSV